jgi:hypothetical protein
MSFDLQFVFCDYTANVLNSFVYNKELWLDWNVRLLNRDKRELRKPLANANTQKAESRKQKAESRKQKAESRKQKAEKKHQRPKRKEILLAHVTPLQPTAKG